MPAKRAEGVRFAGAFHPKIWILKFPNFIRIVIGS
jgi:tyrosyl-DNA phosphodiesterase-1